MVDAVTPLMRQIASPEALAKWDEVNRRSVPEAPEAVMLLDAFAKIDAAAPLRELPAVVLRSDKPWQPPSAPQVSDPAAGVTFADWQASEKLLATSLNAKFIAKTNSGHNIYAYSPQLVIDAIREVVDAVRAGTSRITPDHPQRGVITKSVGGTRVVQLVSTAFRTSKKSRTMVCAQALAAGDGLANATCATLGISTTVAFGSVRATRGPNDGCGLCVILRRDDERRDAALA